jgi:hypothetical protein
MMNNQLPFTCPRCDHLDKTAHEIHPGCGHRYLRDYIDTDVRSREQKYQEIHKGKFRRTGILVWDLLEPALSMLDLVLRIFLLFLGN